VSEYAEYAEYVRRAEDARRSAWDAIWERLAARLEEKVKPIPEAFRAEPTTDPERIAAARARVVADRKRHVETPAWIVALAKEEA
jgi:hypothetical protein